MAILKENFHIHSSYCDGRDTPEEIVEAALAENFTAIGFSGHVHLPDLIQGDTDWYMTPENTELFKKEVRRLKEKYKDKIRIELGVEQDLFGDMPVDDYTYVIGSVHLMKKNDAVYCVDAGKDILINAIKDLYDGDPYAMVEDYFHHVEMLAEFKRIDIIGHFDIVSKFNADGDLFDEAHPRYQAAAKKAADKLLKLNIPFEINSGAMARGYRSDPYPSRWIMEYLRDKGAEFVITGDTHNKEFISFGFDNSVRIAEELGLNVINFSERIDEKSSASPDEKKIERSDEKKSSEADEEYWDIYDKHKKLTGRRMKRNDWILADDEYHLSVLAVVARPDGRILITQRAMDKRWAPGWWEVSGGACQAGESSIDAITREVREEVGLDVSKAAGGFVMDYHRENPGEGDNYFVDVYRFVLDFDESDIKLQNTEAIGFKIVDKEELKALGEQGIFLHYQSIYDVLFM